MTAPASPAHTIPTPDTGKALQATPHFRWYHYRPSDHIGTLQQGWAVRETGQIEWRDVPHFTEPKW